MRLDQLGAMAGGSRQSAIRLPRKHECQRREEVNAEKMALCGRCLGADASARARRGLQSGSRQYGKSHGRREVAPIYRKRRLFFLGSECGSGNAVAAL